MTRREENLLKVLAALFRLHRDGKSEDLGKAMRQVEVVLLNPSGIQCEGVALDLLKLSPEPERRPGIFSGGVFLASDITAATTKK